MRKKIILKGIGACPGKVKGAVKIIKFPEEMSEANHQEILVVDFLTPEFLPYVRGTPGILGIITNKGGVTCHAAIVAREYQIPLVVGTRKATRVLKKGRRVGFDGKSGIVWEEI